MFVQTPLGFTEDGDFFLNSQALQSVRLEFGKMLLSRYGHYLKT